MLEQSGTLHGCTTYDGRRVDGRLQDVHAIYEKDWVSRSHEAKDACDQEFGRNVQTTSLLATL